MERVIIIMVLAVAVFVASLIAGALMFVRAGIAREEADHSLRARPATRIAAVTRRVVGLHVRMPLDLPQGSETTARSGAGQGHWKSR